MLKRKNLRSEVVTITSRLPAEVRDAAIRAAEHHSVRLGDVQSEAMALYVRLDVITREFLLEVDQTIAELTLEVMESYLSDSHKKRGIK